MIRTAHLFAGAGGGLYADLILGHTPVLAIEIDEFCCEVLNERKADGWWPDLHVHYGDVQEFDFMPWRGRVDCISAGFPCQDISCAGKGAGIHGERSGLWREVIRAVGIIQPKFVFIENSPLIKIRGRHVIISELVALGYSWRDGILSAADVGAPHLRKRWWLLATNNDGIRSLREQNATTWDFVDGEDTGRQEEEICGAAERNENFTDSDRKHGDMGRFHAGSISQFETTGISGHEEHADALRNRLEIAIQQGRLSETDAQTIQAVAGYTGKHDWALPDAGVCGVVHGLSNKFNGIGKEAKKTNAILNKKRRIKALGNGQVPLQAAVAWRILSESGYPFSDRIIRLPKNKQASWLFNRVA